MQRRVDERVAWQARSRLDEALLGATLALAVAVRRCSAVARGAGAKPPASFDPLVEAKNFSITLQRQAIYDTPSYQAKLSAISAGNLTNALVTQAADPGRLFTADLCWNQGNGCAGDIRLNDWATSGYGLVRPVLFTARDGATLSGHVWATVAGPARRPAVVITNGSVQADEQMYWYAAQTLAKAGYVVLTFDPQGQGQSDTFGQGADSLEGVPAQTDGRPFYDGTEDALNFLLSTPQHPYEPVRSCSSGTSHAAKQDLRVSQRLDAAYNPYWELINRAEIGLAGHSYGAAGVSYIAQWDPRVKAVVAWDNLGGAGPHAAPVPGASSSSTIGEASCPADPSARRSVPITKPGLGISADYGLPLCRTSRCRTRTASRCCRWPTAAPPWTPVRSSSEAARTSTSALSPTRPSAPRCVARTSRTGTRRLGLTATSSTTEPRICGCSATAGATIP